jgi:hypothetical protein
MIQVTGAKIKTLRFERTSEGELRLVGRYELMSNAGTVLATQGFNEYGGMTVAFSPTTMKLIHELLASAQTDLAAIIGL